MCADLTVKRCPYTSKSFPSFHRTLMSVEFGKDIEQWFPLVLVNYYFDGTPQKFSIEKHGNRTTSNMPHTRAKESTKLALKEKTQEYGPKRALFEVTKQVDGVRDVTDISSLPRNEQQVKYIRRQQHQSEANGKDPLATVLEMQKSNYGGFVRQVVCNDRPTIMSFTDRQLDNIVKFCCQKKFSQVSELSVDVTFQLGPFYLLVTTFRNTILQVKPQPFVYWSCHDLHDQR